MVQSNYQESAENLTPCLHANPVQDLLSVSVRFRLSVAGAIMAGVQEFTRISHSKITVEEPDSEMSLKKSVCGSLLFAIALPLNVCFAQNSPSLEDRVPWTQSGIKGSPNSPLPYVTVPAFPKLKFQRCIDVAVPPGSRRIFVLQQNGQLVSFLPLADVAETDLVLDVKTSDSDFRNTYAVTFHPRFEENRFCYLCCIGPPNEDDATHIVRYTVSDTNPPVIDPSTAKTIIRWRSGGHNGCCLKFGPDGFLYISTGDAAPPNPPDNLRTGQDVTDLLSSILRIDVDCPDDQPYRIPDDNPFQDPSVARPEIWAYGFRNPWRMSFDRKSGDLWVGDVGWELREMLQRVERGGNYGWAVMEGTMPTNPEWPQGPTPILPPTIEHPHSESSSITDGLTCYDTRLPKLDGHHIYGDYDTGKIWAFQFTNGQVVNHREIADTTHRIVGFGEQPDGQVLIVDHIGGALYSLIPNPAPDRSSEFPHMLSQTGLFTSTAAQQPTPGVVEYSVNTEPWADFATSQRFVGVPGSGQIVPTDKAWSFPENSVLVKTLSLEMEAGNEASSQKIETQILHFDGLDWQPYTYQWNADGSDAELVEASGAERVIEVSDSSAPDGVRRQVWRFSGRAECQRCHNKWSGPPLGFNAQQLSKTHQYGTNAASQIATLAHIELIKPPKEPTVKLVDPTNHEFSLDLRARSYLHANCSHCHRLHAGGAVLSHMHADLQLDRTNMLDQRPSQGTFGIHRARVIAPGDPYRSVLFLRVSKLGSGRMPRLGSSEVDPIGTRLIHDWVRSLAGESDRGSEFEAELGRLSKGRGDLSEQIRQMLSSTHGALRVLQAIDSQELSSDVAGQVIATAAGHSNVAIRDLFERFVTPDQRVRRLGAAVNPQQILALKGDVDRGRKLFFEAEGFTCRNCHRAGKEGREIGPDLAGVGTRLKREQILESILDPSRRVDPKYVSWLAETSRGKVISGLLVKKTDDEVVLRDAQNKLHTIPGEQLEQLVSQRQSIMPELLVKDMSAEQVADLLAWLGTLTQKENTP